MNAGKFSLQAMIKTLEQEFAGELPVKLSSVLREAYEGHAGQFRTSRNPKHRVPFIVHPVGVAKLAIQYYPIAENLTDDLETVACVALAHDLLEDTRVTSSHIEDEAGPKVRGYVEALTKLPAGIAGRSGQERNRELLQNILRAGPTAVFVKICDSIHNLGSPSFTPTELLAKTIEKAKKQYLSLLDSCPLGIQLRQIYLATIENAERCYREESKFVHTDPLFRTLDDAIRECVAASAGKVLELHDITTILKRISGIENVGCWQLKSAKDGLFEPVTGLGPEVRTLRWPAGELIETPQILKGTSAQRIGGYFCVKKPDAVITVAFRIDSETTFVIALALESAIERMWLNTDTASLLVQFLTHRLILSEADRRGRLAIEAANLGLQLRTEVAACLGVQPSQLSELQQWRSQCEQAMAIVSHTLTLILMERSYLFPLAKEIRIESRVKSVDSIMLKMLTTHSAWPNYKSIEDIAGVRVVCPTQAAILQIEQALLSATTGIRLHPSISDSRRDYVANPTSNGYRALHLILEVETQIGKQRSCKVPCEVQLRTMFQDTWAKLSHAIAYHAGSEANWHVEQLKKLSTTLKSFEECFEEPGNNRGKLA